jgi:hypothetical protein
MKKTAKKSPAAKKKAKPAVKAAAKKSAKPAPKARTAAKPDAGTYTPRPIQGVGWAPFRYPLQ